MVRVWGGGLGFDGIAGAGGWLNAQESGEYRKRGFQERKHLQKFTEVVMSA